MFLQFTLKRGDSEFSRDFAASSLLLLNRVWLFATPWTAACQTSLSITNSRSLLKLMSIESVIWILLPFRCKRTQHALQWVRKQSPGAFLESSPWLVLTGSSGTGIWEDLDPTQTFILTLLRSQACCSPWHVNTELKTLWAVDSDFSWL